MVCQRLLLITLLVVGATPTTHATTMAQLTKMLNVKAHRTGKLTPKDQKLHQIIDDKCREIKDSSTQENTYPTSENLFGKDPITPNASSYKDKLQLEKKFANAQEDPTTATTLNLGNEAGTFTTPTLGQLHNDSDKKKVASNPGTLNVVFDSVVDFIRNPDNNNAAFQVASNYNCLETAKHTDWPNLITNYLNDVTQGPFASLTTLPALMLRRYACNTGGVQGAQTQQNQINLISAITKEQKNFLLNEEENIVEQYRTTSDGFLSNGYLVLPSNEPDLKEFLKKLNDKQNEVCIGYHKGALVTHNPKYKKNKIELTYAPMPNQRVDQIFFAALNLSYSSGGANSTTYSQHENVVKEIAKKIISIAYEGAVKGAIANNRTKLFLTLIGCGAFGNDPEWVLDAINNQCDLIKNSGLQVSVIFTDAKSFFYKFNENARERLRDMVYKSGGKINGETATPEYVSENEKKYEEWY